MGKISKFLSENAHWVTVVIALLICGFFLLITHPSESGEYRTLDGNDAYIYESTEQVMQEARDAIIEYSEKEIPAVVENADGTTSEIDVPTVESIDGGEILNEENCPEGEECGLGAFVYAPTETYEAFKNYTIGKCWNIDGYAGSQCWDLVSLHSMNYTKDKRVFSTCGTGAARGMWSCKEQNAGTEYDLVYDVYKTRVGDIGVWNGGTYGHTCIIAGPVTNGYVACYGQNQGGSACPGGGGAANIINLSINGFLGAFHPKTYVDPEPTPPTPEPTPAPSPVSDCSTWNVQKGDTMSGIMLACKGYVDWATMNDYANHWTSQNANPGLTVFYGWTHGTGYGLFAGDTIKYSE